MRVRLSDNTGCSGEVGSALRGGDHEPRANVIPLRHRNLRRLHDCPKSIAQTLTIYFISLINQYSKIGTPLDVRGALLGRKAWDQQLHGS